MSHRPSEEESIEPLTQPGTKDTATAMLLAVIFGPLGLFYLSFKNVIISIFVFFPILLMSVTLAVNSERTLGDNVGTFVILGVIAAFAGNAAYAYSATKRHNAQN